MKALLLALGLVALIGGGLMALDSSIQAKIDRQVEPIRQDVKEMGGDVKAIRSLFEKLALEGNFSGG